MELRHVRYFVATADAGSVSAAAAEVHVTQPALSRQLRQLERDLGVALFDRGAGRLVLNRTGRALLPAARELLASAASLEARARFHAVGGLERLVIAAPTVTLTDLVSPFVATLTTDDPVIDVRAGDGESPAHMLARGADLAIGTQRPEAPLAHLDLPELQVTANVRPDDPWAGRGRVDLGELLTRPVVTVPPTYTAREALETALSASGSAPGPGRLIEAANGTIAQALAASGRGVAVVSDDPRYDLVPLGVDVDGAPLGVRLVVAWDPAGVAAGAIEELAVRLASWVGHRYGATAGSGRGGQVGASKVTSSTKQ